MLASLLHSTRGDMYRILSAARTLNSICLGPAIRGAQTRSAVLAPSRRLVSSRSSLNNVAKTYPLCRTLETLSLEDKVCVITGAARGLGYSFAEAFIESGSTRVALVDLSPDATEAAATNLSEWATEKGIGPVEVVAYPLNVTDERAVQESMGKIVEKWGKIDCILTAAGVVHNYSSFEYPSERMKSLYNVNVHGSFYCARAAAQHMMALGTGGSIIFISSMSGRIVNWPQLQMPYNASKAAVRQMAASLACEWAEHQIRVNAISPGYIETSMTGPIVEKYGRGMLDEWIRGTPMKRLGLPEDLKGAAVLLASDASKFTTGSELVIDGGYTCL